MDIWSNIEIIFFSILERTKNLYLKSGHGTFEDNGTIYSSIVGTV